MDGVVSADIEALLSEDGSIFDRLMSIPHADDQTGGEAIWGRAVGHRLERRIANRMRSLIGEGPAGA